MERHTTLESRKTLDQLAREASHHAAQLDAMGPALRALGDIELVVDFDDLRARFAPVAPSAPSTLHAVRA